MGNFCWKNIYSWILHLCLRFFTITFFSSSIDFYCGSSSSQTVVIIKLTKKIKFRFFGIPNLKNIFSCEQTAITWEASEKIFQFMFKIVGAYAIYIISFIAINFDLFFLVGLWNFCNNFVSIKNLELSSSFYFMVSSVQNASRMLKVCIIL